MYRNNLATVLVETGRMDEAWSQFAALNTPAVAHYNLGGAAGAIVSLGTAGPVELVATGQVSKGLGAILSVVFGIVQAVVAIAGHVVGADFSQRGPGSVPPPSSPLGPVQPTVQQPWWPAPMPARMQMPARIPMPMPEPDEAVTGPQVVIGPEFRRDGEQQGH